MPTMYHHFACFRLSTYLFFFVHESVRASVQLEIHSPENTNKITDVLAFTCTTFHFISNFTASLYDRKIWPVCIWEW